MRRSSRYLSMVLSLAVLLALGYRLYDAPIARPAVAKPAPVVPSVEAAPKPRPAALAAVRLPPPPPPRPAAKPAPMPVPKPPPRIELSKKLNVTPLKPAPGKTVPAIPVFRPLKPAAQRARQVADRAESAAPPAAESTVAPDAVAATEGRVLLRMLEHGTGPAIEIAWPAQAHARASLYRRLSTCFGLRVAILDGDGRLYTADIAPGRPWPLNLDAFSGFMRQHDASASPEETQELRRIRDVHGLAARGEAVRVFPRHVDALLLGGLQRIVGEGYAASREIRARYALRRGRIFVENVAVDGQKQKGRVDLTAAAGVACRDARV